MNNGLGFALCFSWHPILYNLQFSFRLYYCEYLINNCLFFPYDLRMRGENRVGILNGISRDCHRIEILMRFHVNFGFSRLKNSLDLGFWGRDAKDMILRIDCWCLRKIKTSSMIKSVINVWIQCHWIEWNPSIRIDLGEIEP